jgi:hypothetical protein
MEFLKMKYPNTLFVITPAIATFWVALSAKADTVKARCDMYPL